MSNCKKLQLNLNLIVSRSKSVLKIDSWLTYSNIVYILKNSLSKSSQISLSHREISGYDILEFESIIIDV